MEEFDVYKDIRERTGGDIYLGVVGPVRAGKSTFIRSFMQNLVMPRLADDPEKSRMLDELPQSANGRTIMTTQPKFVPGEAVRVTLGDGLEVNVRLVDCVGYMADGAEGIDGEDGERMVRTPWSDAEMPFTQAAETGTRKVISDHSTIGVVVTADGSITTDLPRSAYTQPEERAVNELKSLGKPFVIVLNTSLPDDAETARTAEAMREKYDAPVIVCDVRNMTEKDATEMFTAALMEFPLVRADFVPSRWLAALPADSPLVRDFTARVRACCEGANKMGDYEKLRSAFDGGDNFEPPTVSRISMGDGTIECSVCTKSGVFYKALSEECGVEIADDYELMTGVKAMAKAKKAYDRLEKALADAEETGYGIVIPTMDEMTLEEPQIVKRGGQFGVRLKATAPSLHIMRVDIESEVCPIVGTEQQSEELVKYLLSEFENDPSGIWEANMFGKSLHSLVNEGLSGKLGAMPPDTQKKMRRALSRIVNEGKGGVLCVLL